jgi:PAS domain-containing protein
MARYLIISHPGGDQTLTLTRPIYTVGRAHESDLCIDDASVSRKHARLLVGAATVSVEDLGSSNGTFVAGQKIEGAREVRSGDIVTFGNIEGLYRDESAPAAVPGVSSAPAPTPSKPMSLQGFLEGEVSLDDGLQTLRQTVSVPQSKGLNWRIKLVGLVAGTILLAMLAIGGVLILQQRDAWLGRAVLELRALAAENVVGLSAGNLALLSATAVEGDTRVSDPVVLDARGTILLAEPGSRERPGEVWSGWPEARPSTRDATVVEPRSGAAASRPRILLPVTTDGRLIGWVAAEWDRVAARSSGGIVGIAIAIGGFLVLLSYLVLEGATAWVTRPVRRMAAEVRSLRRDERLAYTPPSGLPEIGELSQAVMLALAAAGSGARPAEAAAAAELSVAEGLPVPIALLDDGYHVIDINPEARRLLGLPAASAQPVHLGRVLTGSYFGKELLKLIKTTRPGEISRAELEIPRGSTTVAVRAVVRRPTQPRGFAVALVLLPDDGGSVQR